MSGAPRGSEPETSSEQTVVHLLRHGEVHNPHRILYGRLEGYRLSALGRQMADLAAEHLGDHDITHLVSSPLERARETAEPIALSHGLEVTTDERVLEAGNAFEGLPVAGGAGLLRHPRLYPKFRNPFRPSWGEPYVEIAERMRQAIVAARTAARGHEAVIVSHQAPIWMIRLATEGRPLWHNPANRECALASLTSFTFMDDELLSLSYSEPAAMLLDQAQPGAGA
jgi:broad specificity phosphatase PhoE